MKGMTQSKGFTLLEVLIVLVILAVLAGLAVPAYQSAVEKSRKQEALTSLAGVRSSQQRFLALGNVYASSFNQLDFDPGMIVTGNVTHFTYSILGAAAGTYTAQASRNTVDKPGPAPLYTLQINENGAITSNY